MHLGLNPKRLYILMENDNSQLCSKCSYLIQMKREIIPIKCCTTSLFPQKIDIYQSYGFPYSSTMLFVHPSVPNNGSSLMKGDGKENGILSSNTFPEYANNCAFSNNMLDSLYFVKNHENYEKLLRESGLRKITS